MAVCHAVLVASSISFAPQHIPGPVATALTATSTHIAVAVDVVTQKPEELGIRPKIFGISPIVYYAVFAIGVRVYASMRNGGGIGGNVASINGTTIVNGRRAESGLSIFMRSVEDVAEAAAQANDPKDPKDAPRRTRPPRGPRANG